MARRAWPRRRRRTVEFHKASASTPLWFRADRLGGREVVHCDMLSADPGWHARRPLRIPPRTDVRLFGDDRWLLSSRFACCALDGIAAARDGGQVAGVSDPDDSGIGTWRSETVRGGDNGASVERKRPVARVFDLLHAGQYRRRAWSHRGMARTKAARLGNHERVSCGRAQRFPDVLDDPFLLP